MSATTNDPNQSGSRVYVQTLQQELIQSKLEIQRLMKEIEQAHREKDEALLRLT